MSKDGIMIIIIFSILIFVPITIVLLICMISKKKRKKKNETYKGITQGTITDITKKGMDFPWVVHAEYYVNGVKYQIKESVALKCSTIKLGKIPIGQRKTFVLETIKKGGSIEIHYDERNPRKAIIYGNEGMIVS